METQTPPRIPPDSQDDQYRDSYTPPTQGYSGQQSGKGFMDQLRDLLHEGNIRRVIAIAPDGRTALDVSLNLVVLVTLLVPWLTAVGAVIALASNYRLELQRRP